jgi:hypothetical protein
MGKKIIPVMEFITAKHDVETVSHFLRGYIRFLKMNVKSAYVQPIIHGL